MKASAQVPHLAPSLKGRLRRAVEVLQRGGIVVFPTDTVYGVGAHAFMDDAVSKLYQVKERPRERAIALLIADAQDMAILASPVPQAAWQLAERFWPGGLTLVLPKAPSLATLATAGGDTVALRIPNHPFALALIHALGAPLAATSANPTGMPSPTTAHQAREQLGNRVDLVVDGGRCLGGVESTVLDLSGPEPRILREGAISPGQLRAALNSLVA